MLRYMACVLMALLLGTLNSMAQSRPSYVGTISVKPVRVLQAGEMLYVEMDIILDQVKVKSAGAVDIIPRLVASSDTLELPKVSLKGRNEYATYERILALMSNSERSDRAIPYLVERNVKPESRTIQYRHTVPYEPWMAKAYLDVQKDECGCGEIAWMEVETVDSVRLDFIPEPYRVIPHMAYVQPVPEPVKNREKQVEAFLDFEVNQTYIQPEYMNNPVELAKIRAMIDELRVDQDITINRLDLIGYASPEGSLAGNKRLSEGRALALKNYLSRRYTFAPSLYHVVFGGENWEGLRKALTNLDVPYKVAVESIIDDYDGQERKERLMRLQGGAPYRYLLRNVYPQLRVAICKVEYQVKNFNVEEAKEIMKVRPQNLSLNEMYLVANTYPNGSKEFINVFETAVRLFPEDDIAKLNAAVAALSRRDIETAERYLDQVKHRELPEYANAAGVLALLKDDYESARKYLQIAVDAGLEVAGKNLEELEKREQTDLEIKSRKK